MKRRRVLRTSVALAALFATGLARAADTTITSGETVTTQQVLSAAGDTLTIEAGGSMLVDTVTAIVATGSGVAITNAGTVQGGDWAVGLGDGNTLVNSGELIGVDGDGVTAGSLNSITNSGNINSDFDAIWVYGNSNVIVNSGTFVADEIGILLSGDDNVVTNSGLIRADVAVRVTGAGAANAITNTGNIDGSLLGVMLSGTSNQLTNENYIYGGSYGVDGNNNSSIVNSGTVEAGSIAVSLNSTSLLDNSGTINGASAGVVAGYNSNSITNSGNIFGGSDAVVLLGGSNDLNNSGFIQGNTSAGYGVYAEDSGNTITNSGTIDGESGIGLASGTGNAISNTGTITGNAYGIFIDDSSSGNSILNTGSITARTDTAIDLQGTGNDLTNTGYIYGGVVGVNGYGNNAIVNSGTIEADYIGLYFSSSTSLTNAGIVTGARAGVIVAGHDSVITNSGSIEGSQDGIVLYGNSNILENSGIILGNTATGYGVFFEGSANDITNSGTIEGLYGIGMYSSGNQIVNTGSIRAESIGLRMRADNNVILNSGSIIGSTYSVIFEGTGNTLEILKGGILEGTLNMGTGNALYLYKGMNAALSYVGTPTVSSASGVDLDTGSELVSLDRTGFSAADEQLNDLTRAVNDSIDQRLSSGKPGGETYASSGGMQVRPVADPLVSGSDAAAWLTGFGSYRDKSGSGSDLGWNSVLGGGMAGYDQAIADGIRIGALGGASLSRLSSKADEEIDTASYFVGAYGSYSAERYFVNAAVFGGLSTFTGRKTVMDNMISGGSETVKTDHDGWFVNPSLTVGMPVATLGGIMTPSLRARYAALSLEDYTEKWTSVDVSYDSRIVSLFDLRAQLAYDVDWALGGGSLGIGLRGGMDATIASADDVQVQAASASLDFSADNDGMAWRGFAGLDLAYVTDAQSRVFVSGEVGLASVASTTAVGRAGMEFHF